MPTGPPDPPELGKFLTDPKAGRGKLAQPPPMSPVSEFLAKLRDNPWAFLICFLAALIGIPPSIVGIRSILASSSVPATPAPAPSASQTAGAPPPSGAQATSGPSSPPAQESSATTTPETSPSAQTGPLSNAVPAEPPPTIVPDHSSPSSTEPTSHDPEREPTRSAAPEILRERVGDHIFELKQCILSGRSLECVVLITNQGEDRTLYLFPGNSRLIDEGGTEYSAISLTLGGGGSHVPMMTFGANKPPAAANLPTGVPIKAVLSFEGIPSDTKRAALIELQEAVGGFYGGRGLKAQFRNIPLEQH